MTMNTETRARQFAEEWIASWNNHDLEAILAHYADEVRFHSPFIVKLFNEPSGVIQGKETLRVYFQRGLQAYPELRFELLSVLSGVNSVVLHYRSVNHLLAAETMVFDERGKVREVRAHYATVGQE